MPEIKIKHVVSFSSEDKVHKAENLLKPETYRKWKCASPGEKNATIVLQFEKATQIHSIDIGNEGSAFVEVFVGRSSDSVSDYQILLVASSFMSPLESRNGTHTNRVRMFGPDKLSHHVKDEKWDCVQVVCTQPFNKNITYGLTFIKFHSPSEKIEEQPNSTKEEKAVTKLGAFNLRDEDDDTDSLPSSGYLFGKQKTNVSESLSGPSADKAEPSYAAVVLASSSNSPKLSQDNSLKRKVEVQRDSPKQPPTKRVSTIERRVYKDVLRIADEVTRSNNDAPSPKVKEKRKEPAPTKAPSKEARTLRQRVQFNKIMENVLFVLSGFVNPLRSELRDKALEMGAKYRPDWDPTCTHLVCAFINTPKYAQVKKLNGRIVCKEWILDCYRQKVPLLWRKYELSSDSSDEDNDDSDKDPDFSTKNEKESDEESDELHESDDNDNEESEADVIEESDEDDGEVNKRKRAQKTKNQKKKIATNPIKKTVQSPNVKNALSTPTKQKHNVSDSKDETDSSKKKSSFSIFNKLKESQEKHESSNSQLPNVQNAKDESETEDEDALQDYIANTDVEVDSGGDTEDELRKWEAKAQQKKKISMNGTSNGVENSRESDVSALPLPKLPDFFKKKSFYLYGDFSSSKLHELQRYIIAYDGNIEDYLTDKVKYVVTEKKWDRNFDKALDENEDLIFVKSTWIYKCHESGKLVPYQPHIVIPDS